MTHRSQPSPLPIVFFIVFLDLVGVGILIPIVPQLLANPASEFYLLFLIAPFFAAFNGLTQANLSGLLS